MYCCLLGEGGCSTTDYSHVMFMSLIPGSQASTYDAMTAVCNLILPVFTHATTAASLPRGYMQSAHDSLIGTSLEKRVTANRSLKLKFENLKIEN